MTKDGAYEIKMPAGTYIGDVDILYMSGGGGGGWWRNVYTDEERAKTTFGKGAKGANNYVYIWWNKVD